MKKIAGLTALVLMLTACGTGTESINRATRNVNVPIGTLGKQAVSVAAGRSHTCAVTATGTVECWGDNAYNQLGSRGLSRAPSPVLVQGLPSGVKAVRVAQGASADHACAVLEDGEVWCWGRNSSGQSGSTVTGFSSALAVQVPVGSQVVDVAVSINSTCIVTIRGTVQCFGGTESGQLGYSSAYIATRRYIEANAGNALIATNGVVVKIVAGESHYCVLYDDQTVDCWGMNNSGQVSGDSASVFQPRQVIGLSDVVDISAGSYHSCAITQSHATWCWGDNARGQIAGLSGVKSTTPVRVVFRPESPPAQAVRVSATVSGASNSCVIDEFETAKCWGYVEDLYFGVPSGTTQFVQYPTIVTGSDSLRTMAIGLHHMCFVNKFGLLRCRGRNDVGQLGIGSTSGVRSDANENVVGYLASNATVTFPSFTFDGFSTGLIGGWFGGGLFNNPAPAPAPVDPNQQAANAPTANDPVITPPPPAQAIHRLKVGKLARLRTLARWANLSVPRGATISFVISRATRSKCALRSAKLKGVRAGNCRVRVKVAKRGTRTRTQLINVTIVR